MKTIQVSDEDYETLMELSKELQTQDNVNQAFPYFWVPRSSSRERNYHGDGEYKVCYDNQNCTTLTPMEVKESYPDLWDSFLDLSSYDDESDYEECEEEWIEFVDNDPDFEVWTEDLVCKEEQNPSLFHSDVQRFCEQNKHHLGRDPHTYARTIWRMPKMEALVKCLLRMNKDHGEEVNGEVKRYLHE